MRFSYSELNTHSIKGLRVYENANGRYFPSITTILGQTMPEEKAESLKKWQKALGDLATKQTKDAADRGTAVHTLIERYLKKEALVRPNEIVENSNMMLFNALKLKLDKIEEVWGLEVPLYSETLEVAGRCDCIGVFKGKPCIIDFKTSTRLKDNSKIEDYRLQLTAYAIMHNEMFGTSITDGVILMTSAAGFPQEFNVNLLDYIEPLCVRIQEFYDNLNATIN